MEKEHDPLGWFGRKPTEEDLKAFDLLMGNLLKLKEITKEQELLQLQINDLKNKWKGFWSGAAISFIAALIGVTPTIIEKFQNKPQTQQIEILKTVKVDTVIVRK